MIENKGLLTILILIIWIILTYFLIRLYLQIIIGRGDRKTKKGFENEWITLLKFIGLIFCSYFISFIFIAVHQPVLFIITIIITSILMIMIGGGGYDGGLLNGKVLMFWDWWVLRLIEKNHKNK